MEQVVNPATILAWAAETTSQGELTAAQGTQFALKCPKCDILSAPASTGYLQHQTQNDIVCSRSQGSWAIEHCHWL